MLFSLTVLFARRTFCLVSRSVCWCCCRCCCLEGVLADELMSCRPTVLASGSVSLPKASAGNKNYLFIYSTQQEHYSGSTAALHRRTPPAPMLRMEINLAFTPEPTVTRWVLRPLRPLPWDTLSLQWKVGLWLSPAAPAVAELWPPNTEWRLELSDELIWLQKWKINTDELFMDHMVKAVCVQNCHKYVFERDLSLVKF